MESLVQPKHTGNERNLNVDLCIICQSRKTEDLKASENEQKRYIKKTRGECKMTINRPF